METLQATVEALTRKAQARAAVAYAVCFLITVLPALLILGYRRVRDGANAKDEGGSTGSPPQARRRLSRTNSIMGIGDSTKARTASVWLR